MATLRQKALAHQLIINTKRKKPLNKGELVEIVGYTPSQANKKAGQIIESQGVKKELEILGFTTENAKKVVAEIMMDKFAEGKDRLKGAELVFKVQGDFAAEKHVNMNVNSDDLRQAIVDKMALFRANTGT